jgi:hypothetical protein
MARGPQLFELFPIVPTRNKPPARVVVDTDVLYDPSIDRANKGFAVAEHCNDVGRQGDAPVVAGGVRIELPPVVVAVVVVVAVDHP